MKNLGRIILITTFVLLLVTICFVGCNSSKNVGISDADAQKLSLDGITVAGNGTSSISNLITDKSGKENNIKKRETSGDGQLKYDITIQDYGASENHGFDFITLDKTSAAPGETVTFQTHVQWVNDSHTKKREISSIAIEGEYVEIQNNSFVMPARDAKILVMIGVYRKIVIQQPANGRINTNKEWYDVGMQEDINITLNPDSGYAYKENTLVLSWEGGYGPESETLYVDGETKTATHYLPYSSSEVTLTCEFEIPQAPTYGVSIDYSIENGTISVTKNSFEENEKVVVTVTPNNGYELESLTYNNTSIPFVNNEYSFTMPNRAVYIDASFVEKKYLITVNAENGNVVLKHDNNVLVDNKSKEDQSIKIYVSPDSGYLLESIRLSDSSIVVRKNEDNYEFIMPPKDITLTALFVFSEDAVAIGPPYIGYIPTSESFYEATDGTHYEYANGTTIDMLYMDNLLKFEDDSFRAIYCIEMKDDPNGAQNVLEALISNSLSGFFIRLYDGSYQPLRAYFANNDLVVVYDIGEDSQKAYLICTLFENNNTFYASDYSSWIIESTQIFFYVNE